MKVYLSCSWNSRPLLPSIHIYIYSMSSFSSTKKNYVISIFSETEINFFQHTSIASRENNLNPLGCRYICEVFKSLHTSVSVYMVSSILHLTNLSQLFAKVLNLYLRIFGLWRISRHCFRYNWFLKVSKCAQFHIQIFIAELMSEWFRGSTIQISHRNN